MIEFGINGEDRTMLEQGDVYPGSYQVGPTFNGPTSDAGLRIKHIEGKSIQAVSRGYQLFDASRLSSGTANGVTFTNNGNGSFAVSGEPTSGNFTRAKLLTHDEVLMLFKAGVLRCATNNHEPYFYIKFVKGSTSTGSIGECNTKNRGSFTIRKEDLDDPGLIAEIGFYGASSNWNPPSNGLYKPMFYQDGDGTYEPYTGGKPGPQPEYPIPIESVKITKLTGSEGEETLTNPIVLRSLPDGTKDEYRDGKIIRRVKEVTFDGSADESWMQAEASGVLRFCAIITGCKVSSSPSYSPVCSSGTAKGEGSLEKGNNFIYFLDSSGNVQFYFVPGNENASDVASFKTWLATHPITILYPLATPTIETSPLPIVASSAPSGTAQTDSAITPTITWEALPAGSCALEMQELRKRIEALERKSVEDA